MLQLVKCNLANNPKLVKVLELLSCYNQPSEEWLALRPFIRRPGRKKIKIDRDYGLVAKQCFISHRFSAAATMLDAICQEFSMDNIFFYKATSIVLESFADTTNEEFFQFIQQVTGLIDVSKREIILEYLIRSLKNQDLDGEHNVKGLINKQRKNILRNSIIDPLLKAYFGMYDYIEWAKSREGMGAEASTEKAIAAFSEAIEVPGQWDIFVIKLMQMLEAYKKYDEIEQMLKRYLEENPEHLNCYIYLSWFLKKYKGVSSELIEYLTTVARRSPSDSCVLVLVDLIKDDQREKAMEMLFMFLDYRCNSKNVDAWYTLSNLLFHALKDPEPALTRTMNACWRSRRDIWPYMHFNPKNVGPFDSKCAVKLAAMKGIVLSVFVEEHQFLHILLERFSQDFYEHVSQKTVQKYYKKFIHKATHINYMKDESYNHPDEDL